MLAVSLPVQASALGLIISEVMFDPQGGEDDRQWLELYNDSASTIDLDMYSLGWGRNDYLKGTFQLAGDLAPGAVWLVGGTISDNKNGNPTNGTAQFFDQVVNFDGNLGKGNKQDADGIALFDRTADLILVDTRPVFTILYGKSNKADVTNDDLLGVGSGWAPVDLKASKADPFVGGESIEINAAGEWTVLETPSGGTVNPGLVPEPGTGVLLCAGLAGLVIYGKCHKSILTS